MFQKHSKAQRHSMPTGTLLDSMQGTNVRKLYSLSNLPALVKRPCVCEHKCRGTHISLNIVIMWETFSVDRFNPDDT